MGIADAFAAEPTIEIKISQYEHLIRDAESEHSKRLYLENMIRGNVPNVFILSMLDGKDHTGTFFDRSEPMYGSMVEDHDS